MNKPRVYLAGPIASRTYAEATAWRRAVAAALAGRAACLDPMRDKDHLSARAGALGVTYPPSPLVSPEAIVTRDYFDLKGCDLVLMALPEPSVGTLVELGWAVAWGKPVILWLPPEAPPALREHPFVLELPSCTVSTIDEAVAAVRSYLNLPAFP